MAKRQNRIETVSDGAEKLLAEMVCRFSVKRAVDWLRVKFPSFDTSHGEPLECAATKNEKDYFAEAQLLGFVGRLPDGDSNRPLVVVAIKMKRELTERTSRLVQFNYAKKVLQGAIAKSALGFSGIPSQGLFFFYYKDGYFRLSLVTAEVEKRKLKWNGAKRQSFYIEPGAANNIVKRRLANPIRSFADVKNAFSVEQLTKEFYRKLFDWYSWAMEPATNVYFPNDLSDDTDDRKYNNEAVIRLITRLMFTWFIRQRKLVPDALFDREGAAGLLKKFDADSMEQDNYYRAILQNLFFATFNCQPAKRRFIHTFQGKSGERHVTTLYRYEREFKGGDGSAFKALMKTVPFLNCALFDCLDKKEREEDGGRELYFDGFSGEQGHAAHLPNGLFFDDERGIISLFNRYEFTVNENDADDSDVALDPELLGKVFENLLGAFNPETQETARKATGSFYTPREIVDYMVEESLKGYLRTSLAERATAKQPAACLAEGCSVALDKKLADLFDRNKAAEGEPTLFSKKEEASLLDALYSCKILDPACGSGAFPMGVLHCMVRLLTRLDPKNISIRERLLKRYREDKAGLTIEEDRAAALAELEARLKEGQHYPDYERKLYLIENCIYGVDIQPIATQISKLRFFISLLCDQLRTSYDPTADNFGLLSLPNLEAKFVCANTLISLPEVGALDASIGNIAELRRDLQANRHKIFSARSTSTKEKYKARDLAIRDAIRKEVRDSLSKPDEKAIKEWREKIEEAEQRRKAVEKPDWEEVSQPAQMNLFGETISQPMLIKRDRNAKKREALDEEIDWAKKAIAKEQAKGDLSNVGAATRYANMVAGWDPYDQNKSEGWFDLEWMFNITGGFDVVIGNPPYGVVNKRQNKGVSIVVDDFAFAQYKESDHYAPARGKGLLNIYRLFVQKSLELLTQGGIFSEIFPLAFAGDLSAAALRRFVFSRYQGLRFEAFPERDDPNRRVFEAAKMSVCILVAKNQGSDDPLMMRVNDNRFIGLDTKAFPVSAKMLLEMDPKYLRMPIVGKAEYAILFKMRIKAQSLGTVYRCATGELDMTFAKDSFTTNAIFPEMIRGAGIGRYEIREELSQGEHLYVNERKLKNSEAMQKIKACERIVLQGITGVNENWRLKATLAQGVYCANSVNYICAEGGIIRLLLGILNSRLLNFYFSKFSTNSNVNGYEVDELPIPATIFATPGTNGTYGTGANGRARRGDGSMTCQKKGVDVPCPNAEPSVATQIAALVDRVLAAKKSDPTADTTALESEIDALVYKLYGLTDKEIAVVEGRDKAGQQIAIPDSQSPDTSPRKRGRVAAVEEQAADDEMLE